MEKNSSMFSFQNKLEVLYKNLQKSVDEYDVAINELLSLFMPLHSAETEIIERIRHDNLNYLKCDLYNFLPFVLKTRLFLVKNKQNPSKICVCRKESVICEVK